MLSSIYLEGYEMTLKIMFDTWFLNVIFNSMDFFISSIYASSNLLIISTKNDWIFFKKIIFIFLLGSLFIKHVEALVSKIF